jgi:hypothetical protein
MSRRRDDHAMSVFGVQPTDAAAKNGMAPFRTASFTGSAKS